MEDEHDECANVHNGNSIEAVRQYSSRHLCLGGLTATVYALLRMNPIFESHILESKLVFVLLVETVIDTDLRLSRGTYELNIGPLDQIVFSMHEGAKPCILNRIGYVLPLKEP